MMPISIILRFLPLLLLLLVMCFFRLSGGEPEKAEGQPGLAAHGSRRVCSVQRHLSSWGLNTGAWQIELALGLEIFDSK